MITELNLIQKTCSCRKFYVDFCGANVNKNCRVYILYMCSVIAEKVYCLQYILNEFSNTTWCICRNGYWFYRRSTEIRKRCSSLFLATISAKFNSAILLFYFQNFPSYIILFFICITYYSINEVLILGTIIFSSN